MKESKTFIDLLDLPFSRRSSYFAFANANDGGRQFGKATLFLGSRRNGGAGMNNLNANNGFRQIRIDAVQDGTVLPCVISTTPFEVKLETDYGTAAFCIGEKKFIRCQVDGGISLRLTPSVGFFPTFIEYNTEVWRIGFGSSDILLFPFSGHLVKEPGGTFFAVPGDNGKMEIGIEEFLIDPVQRPLKEYPPYEE